MMGCQTSTNQTLQQPSTVLPQNLPQTQADWSRFLQRMNEVLGAISNAQYATGINAVPTQYAVYDGTGLPPLRITGATSAFDTSRAQFGAGSLKLTATASTVTVELGASGYPITLHPNWQWIASLFILTSAAGIAGKLSVVTPVKQYDVDISGTPGASWARLYGDYTLTADASTSCTLLLTLTGASVGQTFNLEGWMLEPSQGAVLPSPFIMTSGPRTWAQVVNDGTKPDNNANYVAGVVNSYITELSFASGLQPVNIVPALPALPNGSYPDGSLVVLTTDHKLYRNSANAWTKAVDGADILANSITAGSISAGAINASAIDAGAVTADAIAAGAVQAQAISVTTLSAISANLGTVTAGTLQDSAGKFVINLAGQTQTIKDGANTTRVMIGKIGTDYGIQVFGALGAKIFDASSGAWDATNNQPVATTAANAQTTANNATSAASTAQSTANQANTTANNATSAASTAQSTANQANTTANNATSAASTAQSTANQANTTAQNLNIVNLSMAQGMLGWTCAPTSEAANWYGETGANGPNGGTSTYIVHRVSGTTSTLDNTLMPCYSGQVIKASGQCRGVGTPNGSAAMFIAFYDINKSLIGSPTNSNVVSGNGQFQLYVVATAPANAAFVTIGPSGGYAPSSPAGYYTFANFAWNYQPNSLDEVPDGSNHVRGVALSTSEIVDNANFELPLNGDGSVPGWKSFGTGQLYLYTAAPYQGSQSLQVNCPAQYDGAESTRKYVCSPGEVYFVSCALASNLGGYSKMQVRFYNGSGSAFSPVDTTSSTFSFQVLSATVTVPSGAVYFTIVFHNDNTGGGGVFYVDTVTVARVRSLDSEVADGSTYRRMPGANMDANRRGLVDFSQGGHLNKNLDNLADSATRFAAVQAGADKTSSNTSALTASLSNQTQDNLADGPNFARILGTELSSGKHRLGVANSGYRVGNQANLPQRTITNYPSKVAPTVSYSASAGTPATATISTAAFTALLGSVSVGYNAASASVTGTNGTNVNYYLYFNDPTYAGGTQTLVATTNQNDLYSGDGYVYVGYVTVAFPASGSGSGAGAGCPLRTSWVIRRGRQGRPQHVRAAKVRVGDWLLRTDGEWAEVTFSRAELQPCVRLVANGFGTLGCSASAPMQLRESVALSVDCLARDVVVRRGSERGYAIVTDLRDLGVQWVQHITLGNAPDDFFWTGDAKGALFGHHNAKPP